MRYFFLFTLIVLLGCGLSADNNNPPPPGSSGSRPGNAYVPGFGEFMSSIQVHHNKLWFAGQAENWELANFEINEIGEAIDGIRKFQSTRPESTSLGMIQPALDSVAAAIQQKNKSAFTNSFTILTNTCNNCHKATGFGFNRVKIPDHPPFSNQDFNKQ